MPAVDPHYVWAFGHALLLFCSSKVALGAVMFRASSLFWYKTAYLGALASYAIVCLKSLGKPQPTLQFLQASMMDENVQYFLLAAYWWISKPISLTLLPFATFSLFHCLTFLRANIIPKFVPPPPAAQPGQPPRQLGTTEQLGRTIQLWVKGNYDGAMRFVAYTELVILARVVLGALFFQNSFLAPIFFAHFLRLRYYHSAFTRTAVDDITSRIDNLAAGQAPPVQKVWAVGKEGVKRWSGTLLQAKPAAGTAPRAAGPAAANRAAAR